MSIVSTLTTIKPRTAPTAFTAVTPPTTGTVGTPYGPYTFVATGGGGLGYTVSTGVLPAGLTLSPNGVLSGTPTTVGAQIFKVTAFNSKGSFASGNITITIS